jgi:hypothetical protein
MGRKKPGTCASPKTELTRRLREQGYFPISEIAGKIGVHYSTVYRWVRENIVASLDFGGAHYVEWKSVVAHLGEVANVLGLGDPRGEELSGDVERETQPATEQSS